MPRIRGNPPQEVEQYFEIQTFLDVPRNRGNPPQEVEQYFEIKTFLDVPRIRGNPRHPRAKRKYYLTSRNK